MLDPAKAFGVDEHSHHVDEPLVSKEHILWLHVASMIKAVRSSGCSISIGLN